MRKTFEGVLVGIFRDDLFTAREGKFPATDVDGLFRLTYEVHLDPALPVIVNGLVAPKRQIEVRAELPIRANEQVEIELSRDPGAVVVSGFENFAALLEIDADDQAAALAAQPADAPQEIQGHGRLEISDGRAREKDRDVVGLAQRLRELQLLKIIAADRQDFERRHGMA